MLSGHTVRGGHMVCSPGKRSEKKYKLPGYFDANKFELNNERIQFPGSPKHCIPQHCISQDVFTRRAALHG